MKRKAVIIDIDGTLAASPHAFLYQRPDGSTNWEAWINATTYSPANEWCKQLVVAMYKQGCRLVFMTARTEHFNGKEITSRWLNNLLNPEGIFEYELIMRPANDFRSDTDIKLMLYTTQVAHSYDVLFALDDKKSVIDLWRTLDVPALHCADY